MSTKLEEPIYAPGDEMNEAARIKRHTVERLKSFFKAHCRQCRPDASGGCITLLSDILVPEAEGESAGLKELREKADKTVLIRCQSAMKRFPFYSVMWGVKRLLPGGIDNGADERLKVVYPSDAGYLDDMAPAIDPKSHAESKGGSFLHASADVIMFQLTVGS